MSAVATARQTEATRPSKLRREEGFYSPWLLAARDDLRNMALPLKSFALDDYDVSFHASRDCLWLVCRWPGRHGIAIRTAYSPAGPLEVVDVAGDEGSATVRLLCSVGEYTVDFTVATNEPILRCATSIVPAQPLMLPYWPRDLVVFGPDGDPLTAQGRALAGQPDTAAAIVYATFDESTPGTLVYLQDLSRLNEFSNLTGTAPKERVGGIWPELGYQPAVVDKSPVPAGCPVTLSAALVNLRPGSVAEGPDAANLFLEMVEQLYWQLGQPPVEYHDWPALATQTIKDLKSPQVLVSQKGQRFLNPYVGFGPPDSMVQLTILRSLADYADWAGKTLGLSATLRPGVDAFFDPSVGAIRRYLPGVEGKDWNQVDGWYLYHPLLHLARLARGGDKDAHEMFLDCLDHGIKTARHFRYRFPVMWHMETLEVQRAERKEGEPGQTDVAGLYAYVMVDAWKLTGKSRYLEEACASLRAAKEFGFALGYQMNNTAWGAAAATRAAEVTGDTQYQEIGAMFVASLFHHALFADSNIGAAAKYPTFLGISCLQDGAYLAMFEEHEICMALIEYLDSFQEAPQYQRALISEYCRHFLHRAWYYYPANLPRDAIAPKSQSGTIDPALSIPLEDLYSSGPLAGGVGQEVYGAGAALQIAARFYHRVDGSWIFCDVPATLSSTQDLRRLTLHGDNRAAATIVVPAESAIRPKPEERPGRLRAARSGAHRIYHCPAGATMVF